MSFVSRHGRVCSIALIAVLACWAFWPGLRSFFYLDDFFLVAIARLLDDPFAPFLRNHFPGGLFYRPLTLSFWWLSVSVLGNAPLPQYALNLLLHVAISIAFWRLLCEWTRERLGPLLAALAFALHPIAIGTSLWLSDRFDLLAVLFGILAMTCAWRYRENGSARALALAFVYLILSTFSKEIGLATVAPIAAIWLWPRDEAGGGPADRQWKTRAWASVALFVLALALLGWRAYILGSALDTRNVGGAPIVWIIFDGLTHWLSHFFAYLLASSRLPLPSLIAETAGGVVLAGLALLGLLGARAQWRSANVLLIVAALALMLSTGVLQAPTLRLMGLGSSATATAMTATDSRVFYYSLLAFVAWVFALCRLAMLREGRRSQLASAAAVLCLLPWMIDAHHLARQYRRESYIQKSMLLAAQSAIDRLPLPAPCSVFLLGVEGDQEFVFSMQVDAAMKALSANLPLVQACRFVTERTPWFFVLSRDAITPASAAPMQPLVLDGERVGWPAFGGVEIAYLNLFETVDARSLTNTRFLAYHGGRFDDVTEDVLTGRRDVKFRCGRRREQCAKAADLEQ